MLLKPIGLTSSTLMAILMFASGCAKDPSRIAPAYVSPLEYQNYSCHQLGTELTRLGRRVQEVAGIQDEESTDDAVVMGIGLVLFWPTLFFLEGDTGREAELGRLKGEIEAVEQTAIRKDCHRLLDRIEKSRQRGMKEDK